MILSLVINHSSLTWWGVGTQYATNQEYGEDDGCNADLILNDANPIIERLAPVSENDLSMQSIANLEAWLLQEDIDPGYVFEETKGDIDPANYYALGDTDKMNALQHTSNHNTYYVIAICVLNCFGTNTSSYVKTNGQIDALVKALEGKYPQFIRIYHAPDGTTYLQKDVIEFIRDWVWAFGEEANAGNLLYGSPDRRNIENWDQNRPDHFVVKWNPNTETNECTFRGHAPHCGVRWSLNLPIDNSTLHAFGMTAGLGNIKSFVIEIEIRIDGGERKHYSMSVPGDINIDLPEVTASSSVSIIINPDTPTERQGAFWVNNLYLSGGKDNYSWRSIINWFNKYYGDFYNQSNVTYPVYKAKLKANYPEWKNALLETASDEDSGCYYPVWIPSFSARDNANKIIKDKYYHNSLEVKLCGADTPQNIAQSGTGTNKQYNKYMIDHLGKGGIPPESEV